MPRVGPENALEKPCEAALDEIKLMRHLTIRGLSWALEVPISTIRNLPFVFVEEPEGGYDLSKMCMAYERYLNRRGR